MYAVGLGYSNREIAEALNIEVQTVKNHLNSVMKKMHVHDRAQAFGLARENGWVPQTQEQLLTALEVAIGKPGGVAATFGLVRFDGAAGEAKRCPSPPE